MSFREIAITIRCMNRASSEFSRIQTDAEALAAQIRNVGLAMAGLGAGGMVITHIAHEFGVLNNEQARVANSIFMVVTYMGIFITTSWGATVAQKVYAAACWITVAAQNALNISYATFLALTGVGIAVIIAAAAAMWYFASQMNAATASVQGFNAAAGEVPSRTRGIQRAGESNLYRRGVEGSP
jgi:hypothetical protein